ncbi:unnamed protein product [Diabrotica balteata]|uniref:Uncharacterized protein n=1 Tax=Diabrotica balteata TaxID=107213 RepID=A0A9N9T877_DIABA|nr:unnamed protein product [Diabrotica balteata]
MKKSDEKELEFLQKMMDTIDFSDEEEAFSASESEYEKNESKNESSSDEDIPVKKRKLMRSTKNQKKINMENTDLNVFSASDKYINDTTKVGKLEQSCNVPSTSRNIAHQVEDELSDQKSTNGNSSSITSENNLIIIPSQIEKEYIHPVTSENHLIILPSQIEKDFQIANILISKDINSSATQSFDIINHEPNQYLLQAISNTPDETPSIIDNIHAPNGSILPLVNSSHQVVFNPPISDDSDTEHKLVPYSDSDSDLLSEIRKKVGHTQMEVDSMHSTLERQLKNKMINVPAEYISIVKNSRKLPVPYVVKYLEHTFFKKFEEIQFFKSIRPGSSKGDPKVTDIRALSYESNGSILYKTFYKDKWQPLPQTISSQLHTCKTSHLTQLHRNRREISLRKFEDLQEIKKTFPSDYHKYYDDLPPE